MSDRQSKIGTCTTLSKNALHAEKIRVVVKKFSMTSYMWLKIFQMNMKKSEFLYTSPCVFGFFCKQNGKKDTNFYNTFPTHCIISYSVL